ncbi:MAG: hypothetical protein QOC55_461 [Thermoleophilaceae bacterium]|nr:hypothetical protein [Thermoleophilaceae bacterium]
MAIRMSEVWSTGLRYEPSERWVRAYKGDELVIDTRRPVVVWRDGKKVPQYAFHEEDVKGLDGERFDDPDLAGLVLVPFDAADKWLEEDEVMLGHARDPFARIDVRRSSRHIRVEKHGELLAESRRPFLLFETGLVTRYYIPREDIVAPVEDSDRHSICPYKGVASYYSVGGNPDVAWYYPDPLPGMEQIKGLVAFWNERVDLFDDAEQLANAAH